MQIFTMSDPWQAGSPRGATKQDWLKSAHMGLQKSLLNSDKHITLDISGIDLVTVFEWMSIVAALEKLLSMRPDTLVGIDIVGATEARLLPVDEYITLTKHESSRNKQISPDFVLSDRVYKIAGFLESLGTTAALNRLHRQGYAFYPGLSKEAAQSRSFYHKSHDDLSVILGLTRIEKKDDCRQFLDEGSIMAWRAAMDARYAQSSLFASDEVWRVLCHELAVNIWEHAEVAGFVTARVVDPFTANQRLKPWCQATFANPIGLILPQMQGGFLELCVADAGPGIVASLQEAFRRQVGIESTDTVLAADVLAFAFDELGTCKSADESWATERHALGRIMLIVAKYGGALVLRSGGAEVVYTGQGGYLRRRSNHTGFDPDQANKCGYEFPGTQIQLILPLVPRFGDSPITQTRSVFETGLPKSFHTQEAQVRGYLVLLLEELDQPNACVGREEQQSFRRACEHLCRHLLLSRHASEAFVVDFGGLNWTAAQFETLLHLLHNALMHRPILLVEITPQLAQDVLEAQTQSIPTHLQAAVADDGTGAWQGRLFGEIPEKTYLETYTSIDATLLGVDSDGGRYIFGLRDLLYQEPLLSLVDREASIEELCRETGWGNDLLNESVLRRILNTANPLFQYIPDEGRWRIVWGPRQLANETSRVMAGHFDEVIRRSKAWRGNRAKKVSFYLPWENAWREDFLECSRVLSRERNADEAAQRLIYRLRKGLESIGRSLEDVKVLACVTAPALLLATAIHKQWREDQRPSVADLGYYLLLNKPENLPGVASGGDIVVVQDVINTGSVSNRLVDILRHHKMDVLCILSLIRLVPELPETRMTLIQSGWSTDSAPGSQSESFVASHALIEVACPRECAPPKNNEDDSNAYWVEPRTLRPIKYPTLRREFQTGRDTYFEKQDIKFPRLDDCDGKCLFAAGHYAYGRRHYALALDVHQLLTSGIGAEIAHWLADICEDHSSWTGLEQRKYRSRREWESPEGWNLSGDVSAVLLPLHSQIHYLWPQVERQLAQRGRRQPKWLLDATLFLGRGPAYQLPEQLVEQIQSTVKDAVKTWKGNRDAKPELLRILIIDDAVVSARTAETILQTLFRELDKAFYLLGEDRQQWPSPIEWVRYFAVLNEMSYSAQTLWHNLSAVGSPPIPFVFEEYALFSGMPIYNDAECPICADRLRFKHLITSCEQNDMESARRWAESHYDALRPIAIDSPGFQITHSVVLPRRINILTGRKPRPGASKRYVPKHADAAIWRFHELMYLSYPPSDALRSLRQAWPIEGSSRKQIDEYERYRWSVLEWCLRNWPRVLADTAQLVFTERAMDEIRKNTGLVERVLDAVSVHYQDPTLADFIGDCIMLLSQAELERSNKAAETTRIKRVLRIETGLALFWMNLPSHEWHVLAAGPSYQQKGYATLLDVLRGAADTLDPFGHSLIGNLHRRLLRPGRFANPIWALTTVAEALFRGRDLDLSPEGTHDLLPRLIKNMLERSGNDEEDRRLLQGSLALFIAALEDLIPYAVSDHALQGAAGISELGREVLDWLKLPNEESRLDKPPALHLLYDELLLEKPFCIAFNSIFHEKLGALLPYLESHANQYAANLVFTFHPAENTAGCRVLAPIQRLQMCLTNLGVDPVREKILKGDVCSDGKKYHTDIEVRRVSVDSGADRLQFRILTNFDTLKTTQQATRHGRSNSTDRLVLETFGASFDGDWLQPTAEEMLNGFEAVYVFNMPTGFVPKETKT